MSSYEHEIESHNDRRESYRVRRVKPARRRIHRSKSPTTTQSNNAPGGIRQRRNKHWNW